jgi:hypothetical protein
VLDGFQRCWLKYESPSYFSHSQSFQILGIRKVCRRTCSEFSWSRSWDTPVPYS